VTSQAMMNAVERATNLITGNEGGHLRFIYDENGLPQEQVIMDTEDIDTAQKVWRWNLSGLGFSSTGYDGTYGTAITMNGEINANFITTGKLSAVDIEAVDDQTGYYTKINTTTGNLIWNMAQSILDTDGNLSLGSTSGSRFTFHNGTMYFDYNNANIGYLQSNASWSGAWSGTGVILSAPGGIGLYGRILVGQPGTPWYLGLNEYTSSSGNAGLVSDLTVTINKTDVVSATFNFTSDGRVYDVKGHSWNVVTDVSIGWTRRNAIGGIVC
jgi:hypothetical protein